MFRIVALFPLSYVTYSRLSTFKEWASWFYLFPLFCLLSYIYYSVIPCAIPEFLISFAIIFLVVLALYEIGYLYNDLFAVKVENAPTLRVKNDWFVQNFYGLVGSRVVFIVFSIVGLYINSRQLCVSGYLLNFIVLLACLGFAFYLHNVVRGPGNVLTFCALSFLKYYTVLFLISDNLFFIMVFLSFTFIRTLEYGSVKGYIKGRLAAFIVSDIDFFRVVYYIFLFSAVGIFVLAGMIPLNYLFVVIYFLVYRLGIYALVRRAVLK